MELKLEPSIMPSIKYTKSKQSRLGMNILALRLSNAKEGDKHKIHYQKLALNFHHIHNCSNRVNAPYYYYSSIPQK